MEVKDRAVLPAFEANCASDASTESPSNPGFGEMDDVTTTAVVSCGSNGVCVDAGSVEGGNNGVCVAAASVEERRTGSRRYAFIDEETCIAVLRNLQKLSERLPEGGWASLTSEGWSANPSLTSEGRPEVHDPWRNGKNEEETKKHEEMIRELTKQHSDEVKQIREQALRKTQEALEAAEMNAQRSKDQLEQIAMQQIRQASSSEKCAHQQLEDYRRSAILKEAELEDIASKAQLEVAEAFAGNDSMKEEFNKTRMELDEARRMLEAQLEVAEAFAGNDAMKEEFNKTRMELEEARRMLEVSDTELLQTKKALTSARARSDRFEEALKAEEDAKKLVSNSLFSCCYMEKGTPSLKVQCT